MLVTAGLRVAPTAARVYFAVQALAGAVWWVGVFTSDAVRIATLGGLPVLQIAALDIPLFVVGSGLVAGGVRWALWITVPWTALVAAGMALYATFTTLAGWGALLMVLAAGMSLACAVVIVCGRAPVEWLVTGPLAFRTAAQVGTPLLLARTGLQTLFFWGTFLGVIPLLVAVLEARWQLRLDLPPGVPAVGIVLLIAATALGVWSAVSMTVAGEGTPLPSQMARRLVVTGPYRFVRNPMAVAGIEHGVPLCQMFGKWMVVVYTLCGSVLWNTVVRPLEERDLEERFGTDFADYRSRVSCWIPTIGRAAHPVH